MLENARTRARLAQLAQTDDLTGALNRRGFFEAAERELARATRDETETALLVVDVDDLKGVNDRHGHSLGDALLAQVAQTIAGRIRRGDIIGRLGGDEFAVVLPGAGIDAAEDLALELENLLQAGGGRDALGIVVATASVGVAATDGRRSGVVRLLARADVDMYRRKKKRKSTRRPGSVVRGAGPQSARGSRHPCGEAPYPLGPRPAPRTCFRGRALRVLAVRSTGASPPASLRVRSLRARRRRGRQRLEVVAALEHGRDAWRERRAAPRELREGPGAQLQIREWVVGVRVEAGRDEQQVRLEAPHRALDRLERLEVLRVAGAGGKRAG